MVMHPSPDRFFPIFSALSNVSTAKRGSTLTNEEVRRKRSTLFTKEQQRQKDLIPRVEKIQATKLLSNLQFKDLNLFWGVGVVQQISAVSQGSIKCIFIKIFHKDIWEYPVNPLHSPTYPLWASLFRGERERVS